MKITAQEEYGLRCLLRLARVEADQPPLTIPEIAAAEGLSAPYVAKLLSVLRQAGLIESVRGRDGGYRLARPPAEVRLGAVLLALGEPLFDDAELLRPPRRPGGRRPLRPPRRLHAAGPVADPGRLDPPHPRPDHPGRPAAERGPHRRLAARAAAGRGVRAGGAADYAEYAAQELTVGRSLRERPCPQPLAERAAYRMDARVDRTQ